MSEIHESISVAVPFERVPELVRRYAALQAQTEQGEAIVTLKATIVNMVFECDALLSVVPARTYPGFEILQISWKAREGGLYPVFKGTLCAEQEDVSFCRLDLDGGYVPPGWIAGMAFDAVFGHRIAEEVARELLKTLKSEFERLDSGKVAAT